LIWFFNSPIICCEWRSLALIWSFNWIFSKSLLVDFFGFYSFLFAKYFIKFGKSHIFSTWESFFSFFFTIWQQFIPPHGQKNSNDVGTSLYGVFWKKICMSFLHDHYGWMVSLDYSKDNSKITTSLLFPIH
jgi:hypothetical protein